MEGWCADETINRGSSAQTETQGAIPVKAWKDIPRVHCTVGCCCIKAWTAWMSSLNSLSSQFDSLSHPFFSVFSFWRVDTWVSVDNLVLLSLLVVLESRAGGVHDPCRCVQKCSAGRQHRQARNSCQHGEAFAGTMVGFSLHFKAVFFKTYFCFHQFRFTSPANTSKPSVQNLP